MALSWEIIVLLIASGVLVGIINTLAGGGSILTISIFTAMGLPITTANGTNRIAVVLQNLTASLTFIRKRMLDVKAGLLLSIPTVVGNIVGSMLAARIDERIFKICMGVVLTLILIYMIFDRHNRIYHGGHGLKLKPWHYVWFFLIGFYGGYIYIWATSCWPSRFGPCGSISSRPTSSKASSSSCRAPSPCWSSCGTIRWPISTDCCTVRATSSAPFWPRTTRWGGA